MELNYEIISFTWSRSGRFRGQFIQFDKTNTKIPKNERLKIQ